MDRVAATEKNRVKWQGEGPSPLADTDPELAAMRDRFVYGEILNEGTLTDRQAALVTLAALTASQGLDALAAQAEAALRVGASPADIREALYQCAAYVGFPRVEAALRVVNPVLKSTGLRFRCLPRPRSTKVRALPTALPCSARSSGPRASTPCARTRRPGRRPSSPII